MKAAVHTLFTIWIISLAVIAQPVFGDVSRDQAEHQMKMRCKDTQFMAESIQFFRITMKFTLQDFQYEISQRADFGSPKGGAILDWQIALKDAYYIEMIKMAGNVYGYDIGMAPDKVGLSFLEVCIIEGYKALEQDEKTQKYEL